MIPIVVNFCFYLSLQQMFRRITCLKPHKSEKRVIVSAAKYLTYRSFKIAQIDK